MSKSFIKIIVCVILCIPVCVNAQDYINYEKYQSLDSARIAKKKATRERAKKFDRGVESSVFVPKGQWLWGGALSYNELSSDAYDILVLTGIDGSYYNFKVSPYFAYFFSDNLCLGARFSYKRSMIKLNNADLDLGENLDINLSIQDFYSLSHVYTGAIIFRNYIGLGKSKRFGLFNEIQLGVGGGQGKMRSGTGEDINGTYQNIFELSLGVVPGITAFIANNVAVQASVNVLGLKYKKIEQTRNQIYHGELESSGINFKIDLFSINIGVAFYL